MEQVLCCAWEWHYGAHREMVTIYWGINLGSEEIKNASKYIRGVVYGRLFQGSPKNSISIATCLEVYEWFNALI